MRHEKRPVRPPAKLDQPRHLSRFSFIPIHIASRIRAVALPDGEHAVRPQHAQKQQLPKRHHADTPPEQHERHGQRPPANGEKQAELHHLQTDGAADGRRFTNVDSHRMQRIACLHNQKPRHQPENHQMDGPLPPDLFERPQVLPRQRDA